MPSTRITTGLWARNREQEVIESVQSALLSALRIPDYDRDIVLDIYDAGARIVPTGRSDHYVRVEVALFSGRSIEAKRLLYKTLVANVAALGVPATQIKIILFEVPAENWGLTGGYPASEIDLGFKVDV
ncbi:MULTISPECIES: tautomerase family protein [unclassified Bradyrhizobium]|uniref:tautomerase family protein n=1 Tax=unclassified Bradyrhizobium TaxID=2631580 RepID=UPI002447CC3C|nr:MULTISPECIES: tautomerase family protein [unclassified Bradyrhizobium]MDH2344050.1 tautomerase family protein [Bradyrhizobium sp. SSUT77]MDH2350357.1 tautomerase family protein [Bradyrhizobium sp. SSUT112]